MLPVATTMRRHRPRRRAASPPHSVVEQTFGSEDGDGDGVARSVDSCPKICERATFAFTHDGTHKWTLKANGRIPGGPAIGDDKHLYFATGNGTLYSVSHAGQPRWEYKVEGAIRISPPIGTAVVVDVDAKTVTCQQGTMVGTASLTRMRHAK